MTALPTAKSLAPNIEIQAENNLSKFTQLAQMMTQPEQVGRIGSAFVLFIHLLSKGGSIMATKQDLERDIKVKANTIRNWLADLEAQGVITCELAGRKTRITLTPDFMVIAQAPDTTIIREATHVSNPELDFLAETLENAKKQNMNVVINWSLNGITKSQHN